ncbi:OpgC domain-containing protein [Mesorhizobium sp. SB112]|uniref:OpgC family protein n=1 Tax=Mesorhizobium sp. SB112 TaxID=3151853 RepID=UPI0032663071
MTFHAASQRDTRIDVFRAIALLTIFVNHVPGTVYEYLTHKNLGFSDSAEAFVLISGMAVGLAYGMKFQPGNRLLIALKTWRRAGVLYVAHIMTTVATLAIFSGAAIYFARPELLKAINIERIIADTPEALWGLATLGHQVGYNNILSMYAVLLILTPLFLLVGSYSLSLMVAGSGALWLASGVFQIAPMNYPTDGFWFLNPLSWQFIFVIGIASVVHVRRGGKIPTNPLLIGVAIGYLLLSLLWVRVPFWGIDTSMGLPMVLTGFDKTFLSAPRLLHVLAIAYVIVAIPALSNLARTRADNPLAILGKHSLPIFIAGTLLAMVAQVGKVVSPGGFLDDTLLISTGIALQFALAYYLEWLPRIGWGGKKTQVPAIAKTTQPTQAPAMPVMARVRTN